MPTSALEGVICSHPLASLGYGFDVPLLDGDHVTDDAGTGFVHTAPGHGREDFDIWTAAATQQMLRSRGIDPAIPYTVDGDGFYTKDAPGFEGRRVITDKGDKGDANEAVIKALIDAGHLVARGRLKHQYPHSWRSKKPVIFRNTPQWFIHMDQPLSAEAMASSDRAAREPRPTAETAGILRSATSRSKRSERRMGAAAGREPHHRDDRGEAGLGRLAPARWGVPITVFVNRKTGALLRDERVNARIADAFMKEGGDACSPRARPPASSRPSTIPPTGREGGRRAGRLVRFGLDAQLRAGGPVHFPGLAASIASRRRTGPGDCTSKARTSTAAGSIPP